MTPAGARGARRTLYLAYGPDEEVGGQAVRASSPRSLESRGVGRVHAAGDINARSIAGTKSLPA